jgi:hypothetical protein
VKLPSLLVGIAAIACTSAAAPTQASTGDRSSTVDSVQVNGALRLEVHDMPAMQATAPFETDAKVTGAVGAITVTKSQLGSLCRFAVEGNADVRGGKIGVHLTFVERLTSCTAEVRVLQYDATVSAAPGTYDVAVMHELNGKVDTIARQTVSVR